MTELSIIESSDGHYTLKGDLNRHTIPNASDISLSKQTGKYDKLVLDMIQVEHTDTAGLAWLMNLLKQARSSGLQYEIKGVPKTLINLAKISDVDSFLSVQ